MRDFIDKSFHALQNVIAQVCGLCATQESNTITIADNNDKHLIYNSDSRGNTDMRKHATDDKSINKVHSFTSADAIKSNGQALL